MVEQVSFNPLWIVAVVGMVTVLIALATLIVLVWQACNTRRNANEASIWRGGLDEWRKGLDEWRGGLDEWRKRMDDFKMETKNELSALQSSMQAIQFAINKLYEILAGQTGKTLLSHSPLGLNELGKKVSEMIHAKDWANDNAIELASCVEGKTPYQVQEFCVHYALHEYEPDDGYRGILEDCAIENSIMSPDIRYVLAIRLRDRLLELKQEAPHETDA